MTKSDRVLAAFLTGQSFNRFEAGRVLFDSCLNSTVSTLERRHGVTISREFEQVPCFGGNKATVKRYWIYPKERERIKQKLKKDRLKKAATPTDSKPDSQILPCKGA